MTDTVSREINPISKTSGVETLLGDPRKAIVKLAIPIIVSQIGFALYQLADMIWVAGLGPDSLSAVGLSAPIFQLIVAIATGIGVGGGSYISQRIGANDKAGADMFAGHMLTIAIIASVLVIIPLYLFAKPLFLFMGAESTIDLTLEYVFFLFPAFLPLIFNQSAMAILRSEGDTKRPMAVSLISIISNIVLDPIFIYLLGFGVSGAAWATLISSLISMLILCYWLFIKKDTYITIQLKSFGLESKNLQRIISLGIPVSLSRVLMSVSIFINTIIVSYIGGTDGVAVYSTGFRFLFLALLPLMGIASALITVVSAAYGSEDKEKISTAYRFGLKFSLIVESTLVILILLAAPLITTMFTWSEDSYRLTADFISFFRLSVLVNPAQAIAMTVAAVFLGAGNKGQSMIIVLLRTLVLTVPCVVLLGIVMNFGLEGVWAGLVIGNWIAAIIALIWVKKFFAAFKNQH